MGSNIGLGSAKLGDCEQLCHHAGLFLMGQKWLTVMPAPRIIRKIHEMMHGQSLRGKCSMTADLGIRCGLGDCLGQVQAFDSLSPGKGVVRVREPQLALLGKRCLCDGTFLAELGFLWCFTCWRDSISRLPLATSFPSSVSEVSESLGFEPSSCSVPVPAGP